MSFAIGLSGLNAASRRMDSAAWDIARTSGARAAPVEPVAPVAPAAPVAPPGPQAGAPPGPQAGAAPGAAAGAAQRAAEDPDLPRAMVEMISASHAFLANLKTIQRTDDTLGELLKLR